tara:strand:+ start:375 stop:614 length:240 start_codon:yes stop_codon:yes gene_type:complete
MDAVEINRAARINFMSFPFDLSTYCLRKRDENNGGKTLPCKAARFLGILKFYSACLEESLSSMVIASSTRLFAALPSSV